MAQPDGNISGKPNGNAIVTGARRSAVAFDSLDADPKKAKSHREIYVSPWLSIRLKGT
jgi:hypothetical protein